MTTPVLRPSASISIDGDAFIPRPGSSVTLDARNVPYATATVELPLLEDAVIDYLDPRDGIRCPITAEVDTSRTFDLGLRSREVDHESKSVTLTLASDEALLQDYATLTDNTAPFSIAASLRAVVNLVLGTAIPGATLEAGSDANVTAYWAATNLHPNPLPASATGYNIAANGTALTFTTLSGANVIRWTSSASTSNLNAGTTSAYRATPGRRYYAAWDWASAASGRSAALVMEFRSANGTVLMSRTTGTTTPYSAVFQTLSVTAVAPAGTETVYVYITTTGNTVATNHHVKRFILTESDQPVPYFSGASADAFYTYAWTETANASPSTRTPVTERSTDSLVWRAGQTAWDFLMPLAASVNMVLWSDENRDWWLKEADERTLSTLVSVSPANARSGTDTLSREDTDAYVTGVVARYSWTDRDGISREVVDSAGTPDKVLVQEFSQAYPGPGVAAAMLARRQGTGRVQAADAITVQAATPGMSLQFTLPGAPEVIGRLSSVQFDLASGFMNVGASGLVDIVPGSIAALVGTIAALPGTIASL